MPPNQTNRPFQPYPVPPGTPGQGPALSASSRKSHGLGLVLALVLFIMLFLGAAGFGIWAYASQQDYKSNSDKKSAHAATLAVQQESTRKDNEFLEKEKSPLKTYQGPAAYGSLSISYPKTWSAYVVEADRAAVPVDAYFHPNFVPGVLTQTAFALRVQVSSQSYAQELKLFDALVKSGKVKVTPFIAKNVPGATGARIDGEIATGKKGSLVLLPIRDKTIKISTEADQYISDFNNIILLNLKFVP